MKVDMTKPWEEETPKKPKFGEVLEAIIELQNDNQIKEKELEEHLTEIELDVNEKLETSKQNVFTETQTHEDKPGPAHGEDKNTIGLGKKENLPMASAEDIRNGVFKREWVSPKLASLILSDSLKVSTDEYMTSGMLPLSNGRLLGEVLTNQIFYNTEGELPNSTTCKQVEYLFSTEEDYLMFAEFGAGRVTNFSGGGMRAPIGVNRIVVSNNHLKVMKGQPVSLNSITNSDKYIKKVTGLEWGFGDDRGNFYDSNFYPTFVTPSEDEGTTTQETEVSLFDPSIVYKPDGTIYLRNFNTTKHNFNELYVNQNGLFPFNNSVYLSSDSFMCHLANTQLIQQEEVWGIIFDFMSGEVGIPDWYPENITKNSEKILSKQGLYELRQTTISTITGFESAKGYIRMSTDLPWGFENRANFEYSNYADGPRYSSLFIPIKDIIKGFGDLSLDDQQKVIDGIDKDLLIRVSMAWENEFTKTGLIRIPFYYVVPNTEKSWYNYVDIKFKVNNSDYNTVDISAFNYSLENRPSIGTDLDLVNKEGSRFYQWTTDINDSPIHPKVFKGCFLETGGHVTAYSIGHRQYICHYKHPITSVREWIVKDLYPTLDETKTQIVSTGMMSGNRFYSDNIRTLPLLFNNNRITYLTRLRNKNNKYTYGTFTVNDTSFDLISSRSTESSEITWLDKKFNGNYPILIDNSNLTAPGFNSTGLVFSEVNGFIGYQDHGFDGVKFNPSGPTEIDSTLKEKIISDSKILNPYAIFFYYEQMLYWSIASRNGTKNSIGEDVFVGGIRVDLYFDGNSYIIRSLPGMEIVSVSGVLFEDYPEGLIRGRDSESFDDVYIINKNGTDTKTTVFMNYPDLGGRYYSFEMETNNLGYKYPVSITPPVLNLKNESGYGTNCPYVFFGSYFAPFMMFNKLYVPERDIFRLTRYDSEGQSNVRDYYSGWANEQPIYVMGESITVNGRSLTLEKSITIPIKNYNHAGKIFISYFNEEFSVYSTNDNSLGYPTEPSNSILFAGYWGLIGDKYIFNFHAPRGYQGLESQDFINSLLPVIDDKQMATDSMGSTFPAVLGKLSGYPRQYYFNMDNYPSLVRISDPFKVGLVSYVIHVFIEFSNAIPGYDGYDFVTTGRGTVYNKTIITNDVIKFAFDILPGSYKPGEKIYVSFKYNKKEYNNYLIAEIIDDPIIT